MIPVRIRLTVLFMDAKKTGIGVHKKIKNGLLLFLTQINANSLSANVR